MNISKHILIVDGSKHFRNAFEALIKEIDPECKITHASSGKEMLKLLKTAEFDLAFVDVQIQKEECISTISLAHKEQPWMSIIGMSTLEGCNYISAFLKAGARGYLSKNRNNLHHIKELITNTYVDFVISEGLDTDCLIQNTTQNIQVNIK
ncbi:MAG: hypothetical protein CL663_00175 [Bacteroidetes bacterium]|nr:hypothetical protein [Bacteroidota bacterium]